MRQQSAVDYVHLYLSCVIGKKEATLSRAWLPSKQ